MIHCFKDNLTGASADWYMQLECNNVGTWAELADAFTNSTNTTLTWLQIVPNYRICPKKEMNPLRNIHNVRRNWLQEFTHSSGS